MIATYTVAPNDCTTFFSAFKAAFGGQTVKVSVRPVNQREETQEEANLRILQAVEADKRGERHGTMNIEELEKLSK
jgi:hypothetical protein